MARQPIAEIGVCTFIIIICAVFAWQAALLPPGSFEPLGSGPVPGVTAGIIILSCIIIIIRAVRQLRLGDGLGAEIRYEFVGRSPYGAIVMLGGTIIYVALLQARVLPFGVMTFAFLYLLIWALESFRTRTIPMAALVAAVVGFGTEYLFTHVFVVDLPT